jgi:hypothetical protein
VDGGGEVLRRVGEPGLGLDSLMSHLRGSSGEEKKRKRECVGPTD